MIRKPLVVISHIICVICRRSIRGSCKLADVVLAPNVDNCIGQCANIGLIVGKDLVGVQIPNLNIFVAQDITSKQFKEKVIRAVRKILGDL